MAKVSLGKRGARKSPKPKRPGDVKPRGSRAPGHKGPSRPERRPLKRSETDRQGVFRFAGRAWHADRKPPGLSAWQAGRLKAHSIMWGGRRGKHGGISGGFARMIAAASGSELGRKAA